MSETPQIASLCQNGKGIDRPYAKQVTRDFSWPGKPTGNGSIKAFNIKPRSERLTLIGS